MNRLSKIAFIFTSVFFAGSAAAFSIAPNMSCGVYKVSGILKFNSQAQPLIRIQDNTSSPYELLLIHPDMRQLRMLNGLPVAAEVSVPKQIKNNHKPFVVFKKWLPELLPADNSVQLVKLAKCPKG